MSEHGYKRWYDVDLHLSNLVRTMEVMTGQNRQLFGHLIRMLCEEMLHQDPSVKQTDWEHLQGLIKSKKGQRWYDEDPILHKAMNLLYSMSDGSKVQVARQLVEITRLVHDYELLCLKDEREPDLDVVQTLVATGIQEGPRKAEEYLRSVSV